MSRAEKVYDVIIVGGGPSGLNTGRILADKGLEVLLLEEKEEVGKDILCAGIVGREIFEKFDISKDSILREVRTVKVISPTGREILYTHPFPFAYVIDREKFDKALFQDALLKGVNVELSHRVVNIDVSKEVNVEALNLRDFLLERFRGKILILAIGVKIGLLRKLGLGYPPDFLKSAQKVMKWRDGEFVTILTGSAFSKGGFGWIVPENDSFARVGLITEGDPKVEFENIAKKYFYFENRNGVKFKPIAQGLVSKTFGERVLSVGECAGQVKTTTGGGVYFALLCSEIAGEVVLKAFKKGDFSSEGLSEYERRWKKKIGKEIKIGYFIRKLCGRLEDERIDKLFVLANSDGFIDSIGRKARFDWHALTLLKLLGKKEIREVFGNLIENLRFL